MPVLANGRNYPRSPVFSEVSCKPAGSKVILSCKKLRTRCTKRTISAKLDRACCLPIPQKSKPVEEVFVSNTY